MKLVIVETPAQAKTIAGVLGDGWHIEPCYGFVRDFRANSLGVNVARGFEPEFIGVKGKGGLTVRLKKLLRQADAIYVATPPGRSGDLMAWHVLALLPSVKDKPVYRVEMQSLAPDEIRAAFVRPATLDMRRIEAELARRIVGRLAGFGISAASMKALGQTVALSYESLLALRLLLEYEQDIAEHEPQQGLKPFVHLMINDIPFTAQILTTKGRPLALRTESQAVQLERMLNPASYWVERLIRAVKTLPAPGSLTVGTLIEIAERDFGMPPERVLPVVAMLFDGGWITHPESTPKPELRDAAVAYIQRHFGNSYVSSNTPDADGIAPTDIARVPDDALGDGAILYGLIWRQFVAAHMKPAQEHITAARILVGPSRDKPYPAELRATSKQMLFDGWMRLFNNRPPHAADAWLPHIKERASLRLAQVEIQPVVSAAPSYYTETSLTLTIAELGVSLAEAVAAVAHLTSSELLNGSDRCMTLTGSGRALASHLAAVFSDLTDTTYAADLAAEIDRIAAGDLTRAELLASFWMRFGDRLSTRANGSTAPAKKPISAAEEL